MARATIVSVIMLAAFAVALAMLVSPLAAAERIAMAVIPADTTVKDAGARGRVGPNSAGNKKSTEIEARMPVHDATLGRPPETIRGRRAGKMLRVDLMQFRVTRPVAKARSSGPSGWSLPSVLHIGVRRGMAAGTKSLGVAMPVAPYLAVEGRLGPSGETDMGLRLRLQF